MKKLQFIILISALFLLLSAAAQASGFSVEGSAPGVTVEPLVREGSGEAAAVRVTVPFTVRGKLYLLRLLDAEGTVLYVGEQEGGGLLTFEVPGDSVPWIRADYRLILTTDAPGMEPAVIPLAFVGEDLPEPGDGGASSCPRDGSCPLTQFSDLDPGAWYHDGIHALCGAGVMNGFGDGTFRPNEGTSRAMLVTMLWRTAGEPKVRYTLRFSDVPSGAWYEDAVRWAVSSGIVNGYDAKTFGPDDGVTREQLAVILGRTSLAGQGTAAGAQLSLSDFGDAALISEWAKESVQLAVERGLLNGRGGMLFPGQTASRAEVAAVLVRAGAVGQ